MTAVRRCLGLLYPVLLIVGDDVIAKGDQLADASAEELPGLLAAKYVPEFFIVRSIGLISLMCLFVFAAYVARELRRCRGPDSVLPFLALGGGAMAAVPLTEDAEHDVLGR